MTRNILPLLLIGLLGSATNAFAAEQTVTFTIEKMTCALCPITVRKAMEGVDGVTEAKADLTSKTATVTYDDARTTPAAIAEASTNVGFPAKQI